MDNYIKMFRENMESLIEKSVELKLYSHSSVYCFIMSAFFADDFDTINDMLLMYIDHKIGVK